MKNVIAGFGLLLFTTTAFGADGCNYVRSKTWTTTNWSMDCTIFKGEPRERILKLTGSGELKFSGQLYDLTLHHRFSLKTTGITYSSAFDLKGYCQGGSTIKLRAGDELNSLTMVIKQKEGPIEVKSGRFGLFSTDPDHDCTFSNLTFH